MFRVAIKRELTAYHHLIGGDWGRENERSGGRVRGRDQRGHGAVKLDHAHSTVVAKRRTQMTLSSGDLRVVTAASDTPG